MFIDFFGGDAVALAEDLRDSTPVASAHTRLSTFSARKPPAASWKTLRRRDGERPEP